MKKVYFISLAILLLLVSYTYAGMGGGMGNAMHMDYGWGMGFGWIFMVAFWALVILGVIYLVKLIAGGSKSSEKHETALEILKKRYAKGEIGKEEFESKKKDIL